MPDAILHRSALSTPLGRLWLLADTDRYLQAVEWDDHPERLERFLRQRHRGRAILRDAPLPALDAAFTAYFAGAVRALDRLPLAIGGTPFQQRVWTCLRHIPAGETRSYAALAQAIGCPTAVRAVGLANGSNPLALVVPCHRVIGSGGSLTGYGGGLERKRWLLAHEGRHADVPDPLTRLL